MTLYKKRPHEVDAIQFFKLGDHPSVKLGYKDKRGRVTEQKIWSGEDAFIIKSINGWKEVIQGDWVITEIDGYIYVCSNDKFPFEFERVKAASVYS